MKSLKHYFLSIIALTFITAIIVSGCKKDSSATTSTTSTKQLSLYLTDDPGRYDSVYIDIKYVEVKVDTSTLHQQDDHFGDNDNNHNNDHHHNDEFGKWDTLSINAGIYNISTLRNGIDTLLGTAAITGTIRKIRITLANNNSIILAGVTYPLHLGAGINNYLYVAINNRHHHEVSPTKASLWIDFDISRSIVYLNGMYYLNPVLRPFCDLNFARIKGAVFPMAASPLVTIFNSADTLNAIPRQDGHYMIRGIKAGTYSILFKGFNGYKDTTIKNIPVFDGVETIIPTATLSQ